MNNLAEMTQAEQDNLRRLLIDLANDHRAVVHMVAEGNHVNALGRYMFAKQYRIEAGIWDQTFTDPVGEWWSHELVDLYVTMTLLQFGTTMIVETDKKDIAEQWAQKKVTENAEKYQAVNPNDR